jgi:hypothetical protein
MRKESTVQSFFGELLDSQELRRNRVSCQKRAIRADRLRLETRFLYSLKISLYPPSLSPDTMKKHLLKDLPDS